MTIAETIARLVDRFAAHQPVTKEFRGEHTLTAPLEAVHEVLRVCRDELGFELLLDVSTLDHFGKHPRFEVVYELATLDDSRHLRVKAPVGEDQEVPSATDLWAAADWHEREAWDMMGVRFAGHPDLKRILMWEGYPWHPLRKDFPLAGRPTEMPDVAFTGVAPLEGGPFVTWAGAPNKVVGEPRARGFE
jgi:NADH-quinone oxidoreductase subunit C